MRRWRKSGWAALGTPQSTTRFVAFCHVWLAELVVLWAWHFGSLQMGRVWLACRSLPSWPAST